MGKYLDVLVYIGLAIALVGSVVVGEFAPVHVVDHWFRTGVALTVLGSGANWFLGLVGAKSN